MEFTPVGIDVSKGWFDSAALTAEKVSAARFDNGPEGFEALGQWFKKFPLPVRVCLESTGVYHRELVQWLREEGIPVVVFNPRRARSMADGLGILGKDDQTDARVLAEIAQIECRKPQLRPARTPEQEAFREVSHRIDQITRQRARERTRLKEPHLSLLTIESLRRHIEFLNQEIKRLERDWLQMISQTPAQSNSYRMLLSVPCIGPATARKLLSELPNNLGNKKKAVGLAGLAPKPWRSGSSVRHADRLPYQCNRRIRGALYMPAVQAMRISSELRDFYVRLVSKGKHPKAALAAVMRKILTRVLDVLARGTPWEERTPRLDNS